MKINNDKIELLNGIALLKDDQCICRFIRESGRLDHDQNILPLVLEYIPEGGTVFDIGAFIGDTTLAYANKVGEKGNIYAFEPNSNAYECLSYNLHRNDATVYFSKFALGSTIKTAKINNVETNNGMNYLTDGDDITVITLNEFYVNNEISRIDFIKIDVEGYELDVLIGGKETINKFKPTMLIEINDATLSRQGISRNDIFAWLKENNYIYRNIYKEQGLNDSQLDIICTPK